MAVIFAPSPTRTIRQGPLRRVVLNRDGKLVRALLVRDTSTRTQSYRTHPQFIRRRGCRLIWRLG